MERPLFEIGLLTGLGLGIPGGETPPSTAGETPAATEARPRVSIGDDSQLRARRYIAGEGII